MIEQQEYKGHWWLPGTEGDTAAGVATYNPDEGIELELFSKIEESNIADKATRYDRIFGVTTDNELVTLSDCIVTSTSMTMSPRSRSSTLKCLAHQLFVGDHIEESPITFDRVRITYPPLLQWAGIDGTTMNMEGSNSFTLSYETPSTITNTLPNFDLDILATANTSRSRSGKFTLEQEAYFELTPKSGEIHFEQVQSQVGKWQDFITLAVGDDVSASKVRAYRESEVKERSVEIEIFYQSVSHSTDIDPMHTRRTNFVLDDIRDRVDEILRNWAIQSTKYKSAYDLYFSVVYLSEMYLQTQYIMLMSAMESFYREKFEKNADTDRLPPIRQVLDDIVVTYSNQFGGLPWGLDDQMVSELLELRNRAVHGIETSDIENREMYDKVLLLQAMLEAILLSELGIPMDHIHERLGFRYKHLKPDISNSN